MSKKSLFKICFIIALATSATSAFGANPATIQGTVLIGGGTFSPSNKVTITYEAGPDASSASGYAAKSKHAAGDRQLATNNVDPKMYYKTVAVTAACEASASTNVFTDPASWTSM